MIETGAALPQPTTGVDVSSERTYYSVSEVAALLGVSRVSIWRWISSGRLPVTRLGHRTVRIRRQDLEQIARPVQGGHAKSDVLALDVPRGQWPALDSPQHLVLFYDAEPFLLDRVADFVGSALRAGECGIVVATLAHREHIEQRLQAAGLDVASAYADGRYQSVDADELLSRFMLDGSPDRTRFHLAVSGHLELAAGRPTRVFGEMVAVLAGQGNLDGALTLEGLWNALQKERAFSLLCGYPMSHFGGHDMASLLVDTCAEHSSVLPTEGYSALDDGQARLREVAALQQKAASLEIEVAERRRAQEQLQLALSAERAARDQAEAALRARDEFLSIASHELRTPITVLATQAQLSLRRLERTGQLEPERVVQAFRTVGRQANKLARLVNQLLDISRLVSGKLTIELERTDLAELVDQAVSGCRSLAVEHTISLRAPDALACQVDALRLEQVLTNVLDNAVKYSPRGGLIEVSLSQPAPDRIELSVRDHGPGIPVEKRERIFERFFQAHENGNGSGMGLGLYVSRQIVELHGGEIYAEFPPDGGTRVVVQLPRRLAAAAAREEKET